MVPVSYTHLEENGTWVYYDGDDELVTNEWKKSGSNYYYLNDDGEMATETWVDDEYYVCLLYTSRCV